MTQDVFAGGRADLADPRDRRRLGVLRIAIGLAQGLALYWLYRSGTAAPPAWPATQPAVFAPLLLVFAYLPVVALAGVGAFRLRTLVIWLVGAGAILLLVGWHDVARQALTPGATPPYLTFGPMPFVAAALFIAHHLIVPADRAGRRFAPYPAYFDAAWKAGVQLALSLAFTGAFWILLYLGAALFQVIGLGFLDSLISKLWFSIPLTCVVFAVAVHLTDVRDGLIRGVRSVALMLLSWLLPVLTVLVAGFLAALPFTGLDGLWRTGSATALVLSAAGALIILINAAYQDGTADTRPPGVLRHAGRAAAILLSPLIAIAFWGLALRIGQHGLTPDRIVALACAGVGTLYALGYLLAVVGERRAGGWLKALERVNVFTALVSVLVIVALFTPLGDPHRLSVASQVSRLERGAVAADRFDYGFLRYDSGRAGLTALDRLSASDDAEVARRAREARAADDQDRYSDRFRTPEPAVRPVIEVWPQNAALPDDFLEGIDLGDTRADCRQAGACVATVRDLDGDGTPEVLLARQWAMTVFQRDDAGRWQSAATYWPLSCGANAAPDPREALRQGRIAPTATTLPELSLGQGTAARVETRQVCADRPPVNP